NTMLISTPQTTTKIMAELIPGKALAKNVRSSLPAEGQRESFTHDGITIESLNLHHGRQRAPPVENLGFLVTIGKLKVLHVGDTEANIQEFALNNLVKEHIDIALLPYWMLTSRSWANSIDEVIGAKRIVAMHIPNEDAPAAYFDPAPDYESMKALILKRVPNALVLEPGESIRVVNPLPNEQRKPAN
ncbi:MAG: hypothetical protein O7G85_15290, partial [Planctomycetota bacterium]|nr:hypothetical protein [Planctomycetota bacterium]